MVGLGVVASLHGEVATYQGLAPGSLLATGVLVEFLFRTPPVGWTPTQAGGTALVGIAWLFASLLWV